MAVILICAQKDNHINQWLKIFKKLSLKSYVKNSKSEIFDYLNSYKTPTILMLEAGLIDSEEFLALIKRSYSWIKIFILSHEPTLKEAYKYLKHDVKGYGNYFSNDNFIKNAIRVIDDDGYWYYPYFLRVFKGNDDKIQKSKIGFIKSVRDLVLIKTEDEEKIAVLGESIYAYEKIEAPNENSMITLDIDTKEINLNAKESIFLEESVYENRLGVEDCCFFESDKEDILSDFADKDILKLKSKTVKNSKDYLSVARYSGKREEYEIFPSKNLNTFLSSMIK